METNSRVKEVFVKTFDSINKEDEIVDSTDLRDDLGLDSLDIIDLHINLEDEFNVVIDDNKSEHWKTFGDVVKTINSSNWEEKQC